LEIKDIAKPHDDGRAGLTQTASVDQYAGETERGLPIFSPDQVADQLFRYDFYWSTQKELADGVITWGFFESKADLAKDYGKLNELYPVDFNEPDTFTGAFTAAQRTVAKQAIASWDELIKPSFEFTKDIQSADVRFGNNTQGAFSGAYAYFPSYDYFNQFYPGADLSPLGGDVWINSDLAANTNPQLIKDGFYAKSTLIHELGHTFGMPHPGDYNAGANVELTYELADYYQDSLQYTVMSYWDAYETGAQHIDWRVMRFAEASTPLVHDIYAVQAQYGADPTTRTGNDRYGFNSTLDPKAGNNVAFVIDAKEIAPVFTIYDAGGTDTLDLSGYATPSVINLNQGQFSSAGGTIDFPSLEQIQANNKAAGYPDRPVELYGTYQSYWRLVSGSENGLMRDNISIAYGTVIENAVGGSGDDVIVGNAAITVLTGGTGSDTVGYWSSVGAVTVNLAKQTASGGDAQGDRISGFEGAAGGFGNDRLIGSSGDNVFEGMGGADTIEGAGGTDTASYEQSRAGVEVRLSKGAATGVGGDAQGDRLSGIENLVGSDHADRLFGDGLANVIEGRGGADTLAGGGGRDTFVFDENAIFADGKDSGSKVWDVIVDFASDDLIDLSRMDANWTTFADDKFRFIGSKQFEAAGDLRVWGSDNPSESGTVFVAGDIDGDRQADFLIRIENAPALTKDNFVGVEFTG